MRSVTIRLPRPMADKIAERAVVAGLTRSRYLRQMISTVTFVQDTYGQSIEDHMLDWFMITEKSVKAIHERFTAREIRAIMDALMREYSPAMQALSMDTTQDDRAMLTIARTVEQHLEDAGWSDEPDTVPLAHRLLGITSLEWVVMSDQARRMKKGWGRE